MVCLLAVGGCSYTFDVRAVMIDGRLAFVADGPSRGRAKCVTRIAVLAEERDSATEAESVEARNRRAYAWRDGGGYDCGNRFPIFYGELFEGQNEAGLPDVAAEPLRVGTAYEVSAVAGSTGYGGGRFRLLADGRVENLARD